MAPVIVAGHIRAGWAGSGVTERRVITMNDWTKMCVYSTVAAGCSVAAHRSAARLGLPAAAVGIIGAVLLSVLGALARG